jgi:transcriptional regulator with XRE-family HTH domain
MTTLAERIESLSSGMKRGWQAALAKKAGVKPPSVADWVSGKTASLGGKNLLAAAAFFGVNADWLATGKGAKWAQDKPDGEGAPSGGSVAEDAPDYSVGALRPPTIEEAVERIAELLFALDDDGRAMASTALSNLARNPKRTDKTSETLRGLLFTYPREPDPSAPSPVTEGASAAAERPSGKARLTVKAGGGQKMQLGLPFKTVANPWDKRAAPQNERDWYERVKAAPKAAGTATKARK